MSTSKEGDIPPPSAALSDCSIRWYKVDNPASPPPTMAILRGGGDGDGSDDAFPERETKDEAPEVG